VTRAIDSGVYVYKYYLDKELLFYR